MKTRVLSLVLAFSLCLMTQPSLSFAKAVDNSNVSSKTVALEKIHSAATSSNADTAAEENNRPEASESPSRGEGQKNNATEATPSNPEADTRTEIWCKSKPDSIGRGYDGTTDGSTIRLNLTFTDGTNEIELKEGTGFTVKKTFDSANAGWHTVTVEITLIGEAATKYKLRAGEEKFEIGGYINKAYPKLTVSISKTTCAVGEKLLPLLSVDGAPEDAEVTYYYLAAGLKNWAGSSDVEGSEAMPKIEENTAISEPGTYYVYAKTGETKNYEVNRSTTVEFTVVEEVDPVASVTIEDGTETTYSSFTDAWTAAIASEGSTLKLLADGTLPGKATDNTDLDKSLTLDLNGYILGSNGSLTVKSGTALTVTNAGGEKSENPVKVGLYLTLLVEKGGSFSCTDGSIRYLGLQNAGDGDYSIKLADGESHCTFGGFAQGNANATVGDLLKATPGMALHADDSGTDAQVARSTLISRGFNYFSFYVGSCSGHQIGEDGTCIYCGASYVASVTVGDAVTYYDTFSKALVYATRNDSCTLKLLTDVTDAVSINTPFIFDLNGHNVNALSVGARTKIRDSGTTRGTITALRVLNMMDEDGNETILTVADLLEDGYAFKSSSENTWYFDTEIAITNVTVQPVPIKSVTAENPTVTVEYGKTSGVTLTATVVPATEGGTVNCQWYEFGGMLLAIEGATGSNYRLPADLSVGKHTYRLTATSDGYPKSVDIAVNVTPISLEGAEVTVKNPTYNGQKQFPTVTVKFDENTTLTPNKDFNVDATMQTNAGSYTLTVKGNGNYTGEIKDVAWKIEPMKIELVKFNKNLSKVYDGSAVFDLTSAAKENCVLFYGPNMQVISVPAEAYDVSNVRFIAKNAESNYVESPEVGSKAIAFTVTLKSKNYVLPASDVEEPASELTYTQSGGATFTITKAPAPTATPGSLTIINGLHKTYSLDLSTLLPKLAAPCDYGTITYDRKVDTDLGIGAFITLVDGRTGELTLEADRGSKDEGRFGTITVTVSTGNYQDITLTINVIAANKITPSGMPMLSKNAITYGDALNTITISGNLHDDINNTEVEGVFAWADGTAKPNANDSYQAEWTFTPNDRDRYKEVNGTVAVKVSKASPSGVPGYTEITTEGKTLKDAALTAEDSTLKPNAGRLEWVDEMGNVLPEDTRVEANRTYRWRFTPDDANYTTLTGEAELYHRFSDDGDSDDDGDGGGGGSASSAAPGRNTETAGQNLPDYVVKDGRWSRDNAGRWFYSADHTYVDEWGALLNPYADTSKGQSGFDWFHFGKDSVMTTGWYTDANGDTFYLNPVSDNTLGRMFTGWNWIDDNGDGVSECYYFQEASDGRRGRLYKEITTPDGYTVNEKGQWTVNGVVQKKE